MTPVPRPARRADRGDGVGPVRGHRPRPGRPCPPGFPATLDGVEASRGCCSRRRSRTPRRSSPTSRSSRRYGSAGIAALERLRAARPGRTCRSSPTRSAATSARRRRGRRRRCTTCSARTPSRSTRTSARRRSRRSSSGRPLRLRPVPDVEPRRGGAPGPRGRRGRAATGAPPSRSGRGSPGASTGWGPGGTVGLVVGATAPAELAAIRGIAPGLAFLVPGVGAQGGEVEPVLAAGPATARAGRRTAGRRPARQRLPGDRAGSPRRARRRVPDDPGERLAEAATTGPNGSLCYPDAVPGRPEVAPSRTRFQRICRSSTGSEPPSSSSS